ncbi:SDR family NAD(P)-dependent oxidoreductase [Puniceicoccus vermicola]|uniref:SDR family oxidoreductase n=1 Tax=Puniceicoccus vermicola TaxID=388746 RepID=A0A7X1AY86_9BACT|nr:SDR family oxidoreductase [Puniceicoccus vermicola]MBC2602200.1 SDR family oxidoreductase [Puniceicoccus vermicola]
MKNTSFSLEGRTALVTGSSRGIGRAIAIGLAQCGARLVLHGIRRSDNVQGVIDEISALGGKASFIAGDLSGDGAGAALAKRVLEEVGTVDVVVLNASIQIKKDWKEHTAEDSALQMRTNFQSSLELLQTLVPGMEERGWGRILAVGSVQQSNPHPMMLPYAASKCAQMSLVTSLAKELAPSGITVNNLAPGVILTDRNTEALSNAEYEKQVLEKIPVRFFGESEDCVGIAQLLCSDAGRYITGQNIYADGGMSL